MKTRREFIKNVSLAMASSAVLPVSTMINKLHAEEKKIRIGIIGAENSHTIRYGKLFNSEKKFPGVSVEYVWGETEAFAEKAAAKGNIPVIVNNPLEMMGNIDALIVDHRHAKYHLEAALPFVKAKIPTFIDKPFCYRVQSGKEFLNIARNYGTPVTSFSSFAQSEKTIELRAQVEAVDNLKQAVMYGPVDITSKYGGVFFYGVHIIQPMLNIFGEDAVRVRINRQNKNTTATIMFASGLIVTLIFTIGRSRGIYIVRKDGIKELKARVEETDPPKHYGDMVEMFRSGKEPRSYESILKCVAVLQAIEQSVISDEWEEVMV